MQKNIVPASVAAFLKAHGAEDLPAGDQTDLAALVRLFAENAPAEDSDPFSQENLTWLTAMLDCIGVMDERLYEHYRALIDLFRAGVFRAPREKLLAYPTWLPLREKAVRMGLLPEDLYGRDLPRPHVELPEEHLQRKGGLIK